MNESFLVQGNNAPSQINTTQLRNFHNTHFPGQIIPPLRDTSTVPLGSSTPAVREGEEEDEEEELGWYHDGFKRTLTDEQIAMFRHSEIQRLLRQRRLKANVADGHPDAHAKREPEQSKQVGKDRRSKRLSERAALHSEYVELRYGQGENPAGEPTQGERKGYYRKIASYTEELDHSSIKGDVDAPSRRIPDSQSFHWPKLGS